MAWEIFRSKWWSGISSVKSKTSILICPLCRPIMLHPSHRYFTIERAFSLLCQQVPYCPLSALSSFGMKKINCLWNHTRWNIRKRIFLAGFSTRKWKREARQKQRTKAPAAAIPDVVGIPDSAHRFCTILKQNIWANQKQSPMDEK